MPLGEGVSRAGLEFMLELLSLLVIVESQDNDWLSRPKACRLSRLGCNILLEAFGEVCRGAEVGLMPGRFAAEEIGGFYQSGPPPLPFAEATKSHERRICIAPEAMPRRASQNRRSQCEFEPAPVGFLTWFFEPSLQRAILEELMNYLASGEVDNAPVAACG